MEYTTIRISTWLKDVLDRLGGRNDTYEDIIIRQLGLKEEYQEYVKNDAGKTSMKCTFGLHDYVETDPEHYPEDHRTCKRCGKTQQRHVIDEDTETWYDVVNIRPLGELKEENPQ